MGMIRAAGLGYEYLRYEEEGQEPEVTKAIEDVSLEIQKGQFIAVLGHNGSGKSTLAKHINALLVPTEGTMWVDDMKTTDEEDVWKIRQKAGMVFQQPNPFPMSIYDNIAYGPRIHGIKGKAELDAIVEKSLRGAALWDEVKDRLKKSALGLSGGQQQRIAIARALAMKPELLLFDEPTSALDPELEVEVLNIIRRLVDEKQTIVIITHKMSFAREVADKVVFFDEGKILKEGTYTELEQSNIPRITQFLNMLN